MQGMGVVGLTVAEISNVDVNCLKVTGTQNIGQGHRIKVPAKSVHQGESTKQGLVVEGLIVVKISNVDIKCVKVTAAQI